MLIETAQEKIFFVISQAKIMVRFVILDVLVKCFSREWVDFHRDHLSTWLDSPSFSSVPLTEASVYKAEFESSSYEKEMET